MDELIESQPREEWVVIGADYNGHVGKKTEEMWR